MPTPHPAHRSTTRSCPRRSAPMRALRVVLVVAAVLFLTTAASPTSTANQPPPLALTATAFSSQPPPPIPPPSAGCVLTDLGSCISGAVDSFLSGVVADALNPLLGMLSDTLLTTPSPDQLPGVRELWNDSWQIVLAVYGLLVLLAAVLIMGYESVQTRHSLRDIAPRIVFGFLAGALSLTVAGFAVDTANALTTALLTTGVDPTSGAAGLRQLLTSAVTTDNGAAFLLILGLAIAGALVAVLLTYVVRVLLTVVLIAGAPIALMFHALPQTEGIARWWWRTFAACLAIQVVQSLTLVTALNLLLTPGRGFTVFTEPAAGPSQALPSMLAVLALLFILYRIPFWLLAASRIGNGRSIIGSLVRGFIAYRTLGFLRGQPGGGNPADRSGRAPGGGGSRGGGTGGGSGGPRPDSGGGPRGGPGSGRSGPTGGGGRGTGPGRGSSGPGTGPGRGGGRRPTPTAPSAATNPPVTGTARPRGREATATGPISSRSPASRRPPAQPPRPRPPAPPPGVRIVDPRATHLPPAVLRAPTGGSERPPARPSTPTRRTPPPLRGGQYPLPTQGAAPRSAPAVPPRVARQSRTTTPGPRPQEASPRARAAAPSAGSTAQRPSRPASPTDAATTRRTARPRPAPDPATPQPPTSQPATTTPTTATPSTAPPSPRRRRRTDSSGDPS